MREYHYTEQDKARFSKQTKSVYEAFSDGCWKTLYDVAEKCGIRNPSSVASRLRDLKAMAVYDYEKRRTEIDGVWEYRARPIVSGQMELI
jgi:hypothetical protein